MDRRTLRPEYRGDRGPLSTLGGRRYGYLRRSSNGFLTVSTNSFSVTDDHSVPTTPGATLKRGVFVREHPILDRCVARLEIPGLRDAPGAADSAERTRLSGQPGSNFPRMS